MGGANGSDLQDVEMVDAEDDLEVSMSDSLGCDSSDIDMWAASPQSPDPDNLLRPGKSPDPLAQSFTASVANEDAVSDLPGIAISGTEEATHRLHINHSKKAERSSAEESLQAHLKLVNRDKYSKYRVPTQTLTRVRGLDFTSTRDGDRKLAARSRASPFFRAHAKDVHFNVTRLNEANVRVAKEPVFRAPTTTKPTIYSLDYYLHQTLSRSPQNNIRYKLLPKRTGQVRIELYGTSFILSNPRPCITWVIGDTRPGGQFFEADPDEVQTLLDRFCYILQRLPPIKIDTLYRHVFLRSILNRLIRHADPAFKIKAATNGFFLQAMESKTPTWRVYLYRFEIQPTGNITCHRETMSSPILGFSPRPLKVTFENRYLTRGPDCSKLVEDAALHSSTPLRRVPQESFKVENQLRDLIYEKAEFIKGYQLAHKLSCTFDGFVGPRSHLFTLGSHIRGSVRLNKFLNDGPAFLSMYDGLSTIWRIQKTVHGSMACAMA